MKHRIGSITLKIGSGITPRGGSSIYLDKGIPLIRSQNVLDNDFSSNGLVFVDRNIANSMKNVELIKNDILLNITGDSVARCTSLPDKYIGGRVNQHVSIIRADEKIVDPKYLKSYFINKRTKQYLLSLADSGGTRKALTKGMIENLEISLPPLPIQRHIAAILSSLDDKIENNRKTCEKLEEMAQAIFKQWFVEFNFPDENGLPYKDNGGEMVESELGLIPKGWRVGNLSEISTILDCLHSKKPEPKDDGKLLIQVYNIDKSGWINFKEPYYINDSEFKNWISRMLVKENDFVITKTGRVGAVGQMINNFGAAMGRNMVGIRSELPWYTRAFLMSKDKDKQVIQLTNDGTIMKSLHVKAINKFEIILKDINQLSLFNDNVKPLYEKEKELMKESEILQKTRDTLLPKLMSGEIDLEDVNI